MKPQKSTDKFGLAHLFFALFVLFCGYFPVFSQTPIFQKRNALGWVWQNPLPQGNPLFSIHFAKDKETGFAVGADSTILATTDGGFNWKNQLSPVDGTLSGVFALNDRKAVVVGARGAILLTDNGIILEENGYDRPFINLSGGEQMAAALSVRLALLKQLSDIRLAFFDEPTTNMDAARRERLAEQISHITERKTFDQLFVISHDDTFEGYVDNVVSVVGSEAQ